jgi:glycerol-3-phosphate acyltransferase PlsY
MDIWFYALLIIGSYLIGAVPFGFLIGKLHGVDIRKVGSCNIGATNVTRTVGKIPGKICFVLDLLKGALPVLAAQLFRPDEPWLALVCGAAAVIGHIFPVYLKFRGGKGVSTAAGVALALAPLPLLCAAAVWVASFFIWRYVSLASILAALTLPLFAGLFIFLGKGTKTACSWLTLGFLAAAAVITVLRHTGNIKRLLNGTENRFGKPEAPTPPAEENKFKPADASRTREE